MRSASCVPASSTRAPSRSAPRAWPAGAFVGITTVAGTPNSRAASATACAWLPDDGATTPRARTRARAGEERVGAAQLERAAALQHLGLEPHVARPRAAGSASPPGSSGVRTATPRSTAAAARRRSSRVTSGGAGRGDMGDGG
jgi:hypothetical protein